MSEGKAEVQYVSIQSPRFRLINSIVSFVSYLLGFSLIVGSQIESVPSNSIVAPIMALTIFALCFLIFYVALARNQIVSYIFKKISRSTFVSLLILGEISKITVIATVIFLAVGIAIANQVLLIIFFSIFFFVLPIMAIFVDPLTREGKIKIVFEELFSNLDYLDEKQRWLKLVSKEIENEFKIANVKITSNKLLYYFNMEIFKGRNIRRNLIEIEDWLLGKGDLRFDALNEIVPENEFEAYERHVFLKQTIKNPVILSYILWFALIAVLGIVSPTLIELIPRILP